MYGTVSKIQFLIIFTKSTNPHGMTLSSLISYIYFIPVYPN